MVRAGRNSVIQNGDQSRRFARGLNTHRAAHSVRIRDGGPVLRVAIVDDHPVVRYGLASILSGAGDIVIEAAVSSPGELARTAGGGVDTDVIIFDLYQPD